MSVTNLASTHYALSQLDLTVIGVYAAGIIGLGLWASRKKNTAEGYFLASRSMTWPVIGLALLASNLSSTTMVGLAGSAYSSGIAVFNYEWMAAVVLVFFCIFFLPFVLKSQVYTLPEFLQKRYSGTARTYFSGLTIFLNIVVDTAAGLYSGAILFKLLFPHIDLWILVAGLALSAGIYTIAGGLLAVIVTETVQAVILLLASCFLAFFAFQAAGGWDVVMQTVRDMSPEKLSLIRPNSDPSMPWLGLVTGVPLLGFYFWCTNQFMVQRVLAAKNESHGRWGSLFAGLLKLPILFIMVLPGTAAILLYPDLEKGDYVFPTLVFNLLPSGVVGLVVAGFLAALMSSIASTFNSASTLITIDFVQRIHPKMNDKTLVMVGRLSTITLMVLGILWAPQIEKFDSLWQYLQSILAYTAPPVVALFLGGLFWKRANANGANLAILVGLALGGYYFYTGVISKTSDLHFLLVAPILFVSSLLALIVGSLATPNAKAGPPELQWNLQFFREETAALRSVVWWQNYRILSVGLLALTGILVWTFR